MVICTLKVPKAADHNVLTEKVIVEKVVAGEGENDIVLITQSNSVQYYINRGLEKGLSIEDLNQKLTNDTVLISYIDHKSILNPQGNYRHVIQLQKGQELLLPRWQEIKKSID